MKSMEISLRLVLFFACVAAPGLASADAVESTMPFYGEQTLTPQWLDASEREEFHRVADFEFTDQDGEVLQSRSLAGKVYLANFFFTTCPGICSTMTNNLKRVQEACAGDERFVILSHSVTPKYDTPAVLKAYEERHGLTGGTWRLLTGDKSDIYRLARDSYFADDQGASVENYEDRFLHTEKVFLVDGDGCIRGVYNGVMTVDMKRIIADVRTLLEEG